MSFAIDDVRFDEDGLVPVVVQRAADRQILTLAYANREAVELTIETGRAHFFSRSRGELWDKGATSGNWQRVLEIRGDCDADACLYLVETAGPACHTGADSCFHHSLWAQDDVTGWDIAILAELHRVIESRRDANPEESYVAGLLQGERELVLRKIGEEAIEVILAADLDDQLVEEVADLLFHLFVVLAREGRDPGEVLAALRRRRS